MEQAEPVFGNFGAYLRDLRQVRRLTLREVEEQSGVSNSYLSQVENGRIHQPSPHVLQKLAAVYDVPYESLMARAGYMRGPSAPGPSPAIGEPAAPFDPSGPPPGAAPGWAFSVPNDLSAEEEVELQNFLQYLKFKRQSRG